MPVGPYCCSRSSSAEHGLQPGGGDVGVDADAPAGFAGAADRLDVGRRGGLGAATAGADVEGVLGVVDDVEGDRERLAQPTHERRDRPAAGAGDGVVQAVDDDLRRHRRRALAALGRARVCSSWPTST